jgi:hypothetical protein
LARAGSLACALLKGQGMAGFWDNVTGFFDNLTKVSTSVEGLSNSLSDNAQNYSRGADAINQTNYKREYDQLRLRDQAQQIQLDRFTTFRGDNVSFYWAAAIGLGFGLVLLK